MSQRSDMILETFGNFVRKCINFSKPDGKEMLPARKGIG